MKRWKYGKTMLCIVMMVMALTVLWTIQKDAVADTEPGSITVQLNELGTPKGNVKFTAYRVGDWNGSEGKWELDNSLAGTGIVLDQLTTADEMEAAARKLIQESNLEQYKAAEGLTSDSGTLVLSGLNWGVYLLQQQSGEDTYGTVNPFLVNMPAFDEKGNQTGNLTVEPKGAAPIKHGAGRIEVTKRAGYLDPELFEVIDLIPTDAVYYVGLFRDKDGAYPYGNDYMRTIHMKGIGTGTAVYENLGEGTYYIFETDSEGNPYKIDEMQQGTYSWVCQLEEGSSQEVKLDGKAEAPAGTVGLYNLYYDLPDGYSFMGKINVAKKVLDEDEKVTTTQDTFYAGIFRDKEATDLYQVVELTQNGTVTVEVPLGGENGQDPITYYVYETDQNGKRVDEETFDFEVSGEGKVELKKDNLSGTISLTNTQKPEDADDDSGTSGSNSSTQRTSTKKTGDDTPIALYVGILVAALAIIVFVVRGRNRKGRMKHE